MSVEQDQEIATILLRLELVSHAATLNYNPSGGQGGEPDDRMVALVLRNDEPPHLTFRRRYRGCVTDKDRAAVITAAQAELDVWTKPRDWQALKDAPSITEDQVILADGQGWSPEDLAQAHRTTPSRVRKLRKAAGLDTETGKERVADALDRDEKIVKARELRDNGHSNKQIALILGTSPQTVARFLQIPANYPV